MTDSAADADKPLQAAAPVASQTNPSTTTSSSTSTISSSADAAQHHQQQQHTNTTPAHVVEAFVPKLRRLNGDSTWLLQVPVTRAELQHEEHLLRSKDDQANARTHHYNLLIDPWLYPSSQVDLAPAFSEQSRVAEAEVDSIPELVALLQHEQRERLGDEAFDALPPSHRETVDAILISHPFTDHLHPDTLDDPAVSGIPVITTPPALKTVKAYLMAKHNGGGTTASGVASTQVYTMPFLPLTEAPSWDEPQLLAGEVGVANRGQSRKGSSRKGEAEAEADGTTTSTAEPLPPVPSGVQVHFVKPREGFSLTRGAAWSQLHGGVCVRLRSHPHNVVVGHGKSDAAAKSHRTSATVLYTPHGVAPTSVPAWLGKESGSKTLVTSWDKQTLPNWLSGSVTLGLPGVVTLMTPQKGEDGRFPADVVLSTHDERKVAHGVVARLLRRDVLGLESLGLVAAQRPAAAAKGGASSTTADAVEGEKGASEREVGTAANEAKAKAPADVGEARAEATQEEEARSAGHAGEGTTKSEAEREEEAEVVVAGGVGGAGVKEEEEKATNAVDAAKQTEATKAAETTAAATEEASAPTNAVDEAKQAEAAADAVEPAAAAKEGSSAATATNAVDAAKQAEAAAKAVETTAAAATEDSSATTNAVDAAKQAEAAEAVETTGAATEEASAATNAVDAAKQAEAAKAVETAAAATEDSSATTNAVDAAKQAEAAKAVETAAAATEETSATTNAVDAAKQAEAAKAVETAAAATEETSATTNAVDAAKQAEAEQAVKAETPTAGERTGAKPTGDADDSRASKPAAAARESLLERAKRHQRRISRQLLPVSLGSRKQAQQRAEARNADAPAGPDAQHDEVGRDGQAQQEQQEQQEQQPKLQAHVNERVEAVRRGAAGGAVLASRAGVQLTPPPPPPVVDSVPTEAAAWESTAQRVLQWYVDAKVAEVDRKRVSARSLRVGDQIALP